jgi:hypothetical protein
VYMLICLECKDYKYSLYSRWLDVLGFFIFCSRSHCLCYR